MFASVASRIVVPRLNEILDTQILKSGMSITGRTDLSQLVQQYSTNSGRTLRSTLPYGGGSAHLNDSSVVLVAHFMQDGDDHTVTVSSGFVLASASPIPEQVLTVTCAHTFEEIRHSAKSRSPNRSGSFIISPEEIVPVSAIVSALPHSDLLLLSCPQSSLKSLPVSPYPAQIGASIRAHLVSHHQPTESGWTPWIGGTWSKWVSGTVHGYRDHTGREAKPGTYDNLSRLLFSPVPTAGSSGGPIIDEENNVVGVILGNEGSIQGRRGWGAPSEIIFEMFSLPGLENRLHSQPLS